MRIKTKAKKLKKIAANLIVEEEKIPVYYQEVKSPVKMFIPPPKPVET